MMSGEGNLRGARASSAAMRTGFLTLTLLAAALPACNGLGDAEGPRPVVKELRAGGAPPGPVPGQPRLPGDAGSLHPSMAQYAGDTAALVDTARCAECHEDVAATWASGAHARSSFDNPWYRASIDAFRAERGEAPSRFCGGCHDPALLSVGALDEPVLPEDPRAHAGINCLVCHSTTQTTADGNGSAQVLITDALLPDPGSQRQVEAHRVRMRPDPLAEARLCGSCHRSFVGDMMGSPHHVNGIEDIGAWRASPYAGSHARRIDEPLEAESCSGCHMRPVAAPLGDLAATDGRVRSHAVRGAHTAMADDGVTREMLQRAATIDVARLRVGGEWIEPDALPAQAIEGDVAVDVVVRNTGTGHNFPGGTRDLQDTWIELRLFDGQGRLVAEAGTHHETADDPTAFVFRATLLDDEGRPERLHRVDRFRAPAYDRTLAPRDAMVARYGVTLAAPVPGPLRAEARLRHRRHGRDFQRFACDANRTRRGAAFERTTRALHREVLDPCRPEPVTDIAISRTEDPGPGRFRRLHDLALALSHDVQERQGEARPVIDAAREATDAPREIAMVDLLLARVAARQGRLQEALDLAARALTGAPDAEAAVARVRGEAHAQVWQWTEAAEAFGICAELAPGDVASWRDLARARGSAGDDRGALEAAGRGLQLGPRDSSLLRSQHLALEALGRGTDAARRAFLDHREVDEGPGLLRSCQRDVEGCDRDRQPVPILAMRPR